MSALGSWLRENAGIEFANGNFVSTSINLKNKSAGDGCRDKTIEKTILRAFRARTFSRSQGHSLPVARRRAGREVRSGPKADLIPTPWLMLLASLTEEHDHAGTSERDPRAP
jgi:hypothetical protein